MYACMPIAGVKKTYNIEMAALKTIGNWLQGKGWAQAIVQANNIGTADYRTLTCAERFLLV